MVTQPIVRPAASSVTLRQVGNDYEIEVVSPDGFPIGARDPILQVGEQRFGRYRRAEQNTDFCVIYPIEGDRFAELQDGAPISVSYGRPNDERSFGVLDKSSLQ